MNNKIMYLFSLILLFSACSSNYSNKESAEASTIIVESLETESGLCEIKRKAKIIEGNSMSPLLESGQGIDLLENYYKCGKPVERGDIVAYHYGGDKRPLIKIVKVSSGDEIEMVDRKIRVNGEFLVNSAGEEYLFSEAEVKMLNLYIKEKHIPKNTYFLFGDNINISTDSRKFGAVSPNDFLGKFEI